MRHTWRSTRATSGGDATQRWIVATDGKGGRSSAAGKESVSERATCGTEDTMQRRKDDGGHKWQREMGGGNKKREKT